MRQSGTGGLPPIGSAVVLGLVILTTASLPATAAPTNDTECTIKYLDKCGKDIFLWTIDGFTVKVPVNEKELTAHCERQAAADACVRRRSTKCHTNVVKGFSRLLYDANHEEYEQRCDPSTDYHSTYLKLAPCISEFSPSFLNCTARFIISTQTADPQSKSVRERIPRACCSFAWYSHCAVSEARRQCNEETATFVKEYLHRTSGELLDLACGSYTPDTDVCKKFDLSKEEDLFKKLEAIGVTTMLGALSKLSESL